MAITAEQQARFEEDLTWLSKHDGWSKDDEDEIRQNIAIIGGPAIRFWWCLAKARKVGYRFEAETGYEKLHEFCARVGMPGPYAAPKTSSGAQA